MNMCHYLKLPEEGNFALYKFRKMNLAVRKIHFAQELLRLNDEKILDKLEDLLRTETRKSYEQGAKPLSMDAFNDMIDDAEDDANKNRIKNVNELKNDIKSWGKRAENDGPAGYASLCG